MAGLGLAVLAVASALAFTAGPALAQVDVKGMLLEEAAREAGRKKGGEPLEGETRPLVIVVHGIGGGDRAPGWSDADAKEWGIGPVHEISFRYEGRTEGMSFSDFAQRAGEWSGSVQEQLADVLSRPENKDRPVIIVSHSWGTVMAKLAVGGGTTPQGDRDGLESALRARGVHDPVRVAHWFTLGSPLGRDTPEGPLAMTLSQMGVGVGAEKPPVVDRWTNVYDRDDPVAAHSWKLAGADENLEVEVDGWTGLGDHSGMWTQKEVVRRIRAAERGLRTRQLLSVEVSEPGYWGTGVAGASVTLAGPVARRLSGDGILFFEDLPPGEYLLVASAPGHETRRMSVVVRQERAKVRVDLPRSAKKPEAAATGLELADARSFEVSSSGEILTTDDEKARDRVEERTGWTQEFRVEKQGRVGYRLTLASLPPSDKPLPGHCAETRRFPAAVSWSVSGTGVRGSRAAEGPTASGGIEARPGDTVVFKVTLPGRVVACRQRNTSWNVVFTDKAGPGCRLEVGTIAP
ncbi:MAG: carboxypeptidase-like regulatory domain-containing protein [Elusimicrobiota bacterium]|jgi:hypothetical protein